MTPEGKVKHLVKRELKALGAYYFMPVQNGLGAPALDFMHVQIKDVPVFAIETKAPGKKLTPRQARTLYEIRSAGGAAFVIDGPDSLQEVLVWINLTKNFRR